MRWPVPAQHEKSSASPEREERLRKRARERVPERGKLKKTSSTEGGHPSKNLDRGKQRTKVDG